MVNVDHRQRRAALHEEHDHREDPEIDPIGEESPYDQAGDDAAQGGERQSGARSGQ